MDGRVAIDGKTLLSSLKKSLGTDSVPGKVMADNGIVIWEDQGETVAVNLDRTQLRLLDGWMVVQAEMQVVRSNDEKQVTVVVPMNSIFYVGKPDSASGVQVSCALDPGNDPALRERWGDSLISAVWDGILDAVEQAVPAGVVTSMVIDRDPDESKLVLTYE